MQNQQGNGDADMLFYPIDRLMIVAHLQDKYFLLPKGSEGTSLS